MSERIEVVPCKEGDVCVVCGDPAVDRWCNVQDWEYEKDDNPSFCLHYSLDYEATREHYLEDHFNGDSGYE